MSGNLAPVAKSGEQLYINFHAFRENRLPLVIRIRDANQELIGRLVFMREARTTRGDTPQTPLCSLNIQLPEYLTNGASTDFSETGIIESTKRKFKFIVRPLGPLLTFLLHLWGLVIIMHFNKNPSFIV